MVDAMLRQPRLPRRMEAFLISDGLPPGWTSCSRCVEPWLDGIASHTKSELVQMEKNSRPRILDALKAAGQNPLSECRSRHGCSSAARAIKHRWQLV